LEQIVAQTWAEETSNKPNLSGGNGSPRIQATGFDIANGSSHLGRMEDLVKGMIIFTCERENPGPRLVSILPPLMMMGTENTDLKKRTGKRVNVIDD